MSRQLRPRQPISYQKLGGFEDHNADEVVAGPSRITVDDDSSGGSEYEPDAPKASGNAVSDEEASQASDDDDELETMSVDEEDLVPKAKKAKAPRPAKGKQKAATPKEPVRRTTSNSTANATPKPRTSTPATVKGGGTRYKSGNTIVLTATRQMYVLPTPSVTHRHRAIPLMEPAEWVERLSAAPRPYGLHPVQSVLTEQPRGDRAASSRAGRMWAYNVGAGPLWELTEDRAWFKEGEREAKEEERRPVVYEDVTIPEGWAEILSKEEALTYLPSDDVIDEGETLKPAPPVTCSFGLKDKQTQVKMEMFHSLDLSDHIDEKRSHIFHAGAPVWGLDWCPIHPSARASREYKQYIAVAPFTSPSHSPEIGSKARRPFRSCIQVWSLSRREDRGKDDDAQVRCEMVLCLDSGPAYDIKWCPLPSHDSDEGTLQEGTVRKLGLLAGTFEDGSACVWVVPDPEQFSRQDNSQPVYIKLANPLVRTELQNGGFWGLDWANSESFCVSTTQGAISVYDIKEAITEAQKTGKTVESPLPTHHIQVHQSACRAVVWLRAPADPRFPRLSSPTVIASGGYDGVVCLTDIRDGHKAVMNRTRDVINSLGFSPYTGGPVTTDHENIVKMYSASPSMLGRGHTLLEPDGPVWTVGCSDYHPHVAVGSVDGGCYITNSMRSTRKGKVLPVFVHKIFQLDYNRATNEFRMLDNFLPQETQDRPTATRAARLDKTLVVRDVGTGAWPVQVGVNRVAWHNGAGLGGAGLIASATASGLCRIDWLSGRWFRGRIPFSYGGGGGGEGDEDDEDEIVDEDGDEMDED